MNKSSSILADWEILELCNTEEPMIAPHFPESIRHWSDGTKIPSYGLSCFGYDVRCSPEWVISKPLYELTESGEQQLKVLDILDNDTGDSWERHYGESVILPPKTYAMSVTPEVFSMPDNVSAIVLGKSTLARHKLLINATPVEAGFVGQVVIEIANLGDNPIRLHANVGIAQFLFIRGNPCTTSYRTRKGKYHNQKGIQLGIN